MSNDSGDGADQEELVAHPIQLLEVNVLDAEFRAFRAQSMRDDPGEYSVNLNFGYTDYDQDEKQIVIKVGAEIGERFDADKDPDPDKLKDMPYFLSVSVLGRFEVNEDEFDVKYIQRWARKNATLLVYPFLREHVHSLTVRFGYKGLVMPLIQIPTFVVGQKSSNSTT